MAILSLLGKLMVSGGLLYTYYHLFLRNKRFHQYNRFYLLAIALLSLIIPFVNIPVNLFLGSQQHSPLIQTLRVINGNGWDEPVTIYARSNQWSKWITVQNSLYCIYIAGLITSLFVLVKSIVWIGHLKRKYPYETIQQLTIYHTEEPGTPFSFFKSIFWDKKISLDDQHGQQIFRHELFHVKEKHSADILLMETFCCICWFNPFFHLIKKEIKAIHEFLADEYAVSANNRYEYAELLVSHAIHQKTLRLTHPFFHNQIKRRITMITQSNLIRRSGYISRIMALPLLFLLFSAFAIKLTHQPRSGQVQHYANKTITVVIDAGHGGMFTGANSIASEKDINLQISQKINQLSAEYNVSVVLTRNNDKLVGDATNIREDLQNRIKISDQANPDLFISIHVNQSVEKNANASGFEAYISRRSETEKTRQFASVILGELKNIYATNETIKQRDEGIVVIDRKAYPSILLECGYLNNPKDLAFITDPSGQEKIARKILEGIVKYSNAQTARAVEVTQPVAEIINAEIISAEELSKVDLDDIKSIEADVNKPMATILFTNGSTKFTDFKKMDLYYSTRRIENLQAFLLKVKVRNPAWERTMANDTLSPNQQQPKTNSNASPMTKVEFEPDYPGGSAGWVKYLTQHLKYPETAAKKKIQGTVLMEFVVNSDGTITGVKTISGPEELRAASIKVIKESGKWISAIQDGKKVKAYKRQPITYKLQA